MSIPKTVTIPVDYGFAFDFVSIYEVKVGRNPNDVVAYTNLNKTLDHLAEQLGTDLIRQVLHSPEYDNLFEANDQLFSLVDAAKTNSVTAKEVDDGVYKRFLAKRALQDKFFPDADKVEQKFGYTQAEGKK